MLASCDQRLVYIVCVSYTILSTCYYNVIVAEVLGASDELSR